MKAPCLCIDFADAPWQLSEISGMALLPIPEDFFSNSTTLRPREGELSCETDEDFLQLLPYITLFNWKGEVFVYSRGAAGGEARLHGLLSIGLGGHVDKEPTADLSLEETLRSEGARELAEEAGVAIREPLHFTKLICDRSNPVGRVHLGLHTTYTLHEGAEITMEPGMIEKGFWATRSQLMGADIWNRLEPWSQVVALELC